MKKLRSEIENASQQCLNTVISNILSFFSYFSSIFHPFKKSRITNYPSRPNLRPPSLGICIEFILRNDWVAFCLGFILSLLRGYFVPDSGIFCLRDILNGNEISPRQGHNSPQTKYPRNRHRLSPRQRNLKTKYYWDKDKISSKQRQNIPKTVTK